MVSLRRKNKSSTSWWRVLWVRRKIWVQAIVINKCTRKTNLVLHKKKFQAHFQEKNCSQMLGVVAAKSGIKWKITCDDSLKKIQCTRKLYGRVSIMLQNWMSRICYEIFPCFGLMENWQITLYPNFSHHTTSFDFWFIYPSVPTSSPSSFLLLITEGISLLWRVFNTITAARRKLCSINSLKGKTPFKLSYYENVYF